jgi:predicted ATPase
MAAAAGGAAGPAVRADAQAVQTAAAVQLFAARARAIEPRFDPAQSWPAVAEICRRVRGLPLAVELAALWVRLMPPAEIAREIDAGLGLLSAAGWRSRRRCSRLLPPPSAATTPPRPTFARIRPGCCCGCNGPAGDGPGMDHYGAL